MVGWLGLVTTAGAYLLFARGLRRLPAATVGTLSLAEPLTAATLGLVVLGEQPAPAAALGAATLLAGLLLAALQPDPTAPAVPAAAAVPTTPKGHRMIGQSPTEANSPDRHVLAVDQTPPPGRATGAA